MYIHVHIHVFINVETNYVYIYIYIRGHTCPNIYIYLHNIYKYLEREKRKKAG